MTITTRPYQDKHDLDRVGRFLINTYGLIGRPQNWLIDQWINLRYSLYAETNPSRKPDWESEIHVWEAKGQLIGVALHEGPGFYALQVHPGYRRIETDMIQWCETDHAGRTSVASNHRSLRMEAYAWDIQRAELLADRGYHRQPESACFHQRSLDKPIETSSTPDGYHLRTMRRELDDKLRYIDALCAIFPGYRRNWEKTYAALSPDERRELAAKVTCNRMYAPEYRSDLDLCIEAEDGRLACICTFWLDQANCLSIIEPMGVHPDHRRRGLAQWIMLQGMIRSRDLGARWAVTSSYDDPAHRVYESVNLAPAEIVALWSREF